jgi:hypothetical protein
MILKSNGSVLAAAVLIGGTMAMAGAVHAAPIGVQFKETGNGDTVELNNAVSTVGPVQNLTAGYGSYAQDNWNEVAGSGSSSFSSSSPIALAGTAITLSISNAHKFNQANGVTSVNNGGAGSTASPTANEELLSGGLENDSGGTPTVIEFSNVPTGSYDLVLYTAFQGNGSYAGAASFTINGGAPVYAVEQDGAAFYPSDTFVSNPQSNPANLSTSSVSNYLLFQNVTPVSGNITISYGKYASGTVASDSNGNAVDAVQLSSVPEPATLALFGAAGVGLMLLRRKNRVVV